MSPSGNVWVVRDPVSIDGVIYAPITKGNLPFKRFLKAIRTYQPAADLVEELVSLRTLALTRAFNQTDPFAEDDNAGKTLDVSWFKERKRWKKLLDAPDNDDVQKVLQVELPAFTSLDGNVIEAVTTHMPSPQGVFHCNPDYFRGVLLELEQDTLQWVTERYAALQRGDEDQRYIVKRTPRKPRRERKMRRREGGGESNDERLQFEDEGDDMNNNDATLEWMGEDTGDSAHDVSAGALASIKIEVVESDKVVPRKLCKDADDVVAPGEDDTCETDKAVAKKYYPMFSRTHK